MESVVGYVVTFPWQLILEFPAPANDRVKVLHVSVTNGGPVPPPLVDAVAVMLPLSLHIIWI